MRPISSSIKYAALSLAMVCLSVLSSCGARGNTGASDSAAAQAEAAKADTLNLLFAGDAMQHGPQLKAALRAGGGKDYNYDDCFTLIAPEVKAADYAVANLEVPLGGGPEYRGYPCFSAPDSYAIALREAGFDMMLTANNHCMDKGYNGLSRTLDVLDQAELKHVGTYRTQAEFDENHGVVVADVGGISVAFLGYTYGTNGIPVAADKDFSLNRFNVDYTGDCATLDQEKLSSELAYAESLNTDLIAVMIHWGIEYQTTQNAYQEQVADFLISHGADVILGSHSHVPQPMGTRTVTLDDGSTRTGFVAYSLGNFVSNQSPATVNVNYTDTTAILRLELTKNSQTQETTVTDVSYVPMLVLNRGTGVQDQYLILDVNALIAAHDSGDTSVATDAVYSKLEYALNGCHTILGADYDKAGTPPQTTSA